jgi:hypothetical protein
MQILFIPSNTWLGWLGVRSNIFFFDLKSYSRGYNSQEGVCNLAICAIFPLNKWLLVFFIVNYVTTILFQVQNFGDFVTFLIVNVAIQDI